MLDGPLAWATFFFWNLGTLRILQQRLEINVWYRIDEWMEKMEDGLGKPDVMIDCWDGSCVALRDDGDLEVAMEMKDDSTK